MKKKKILIGCIITLFALAAVVYAGGVYFFSDHYLPGTAINGVDVSFQTVEKISRLLEQQADVYVLAIEERDNGREKLTAEEIGLSYTPDDTLQYYLKRQEKWLWFRAFQKDFILERSACLKVDEERLAQAVSGLRCMQEDQVTPPQDAYWAAQEDSIVVVPEVQGNQLDWEKTLETIRKAVEEGRQQVDLEAENCYMRPAVLADDPSFQSGAEQVKQYTNAIITYDFGRDSQRVDRELILPWLIPDGAGGYEPDREKVAAYVAELAGKYDTMGGDFTFISYDGQERAVSGGNYGWRIDQEKETDELLKNIRSGDILVREPVYASRGLDRKTGGLGDTYLEIDLTSQRMVLYKDGYLAGDTPIVSGQRGEHDTPVGCFLAGEKESPKFLEDECQSVSFWIPFTEKLGVHDASWRTEFGSDLYAIVGTEGGIDAPFEAVQGIYEKLDEGDPIVIYY